MSDVLSRILGGLMGGGQQPMQGGGNPLGMPGEGGRFGGGYAGGGQMGGGNPMGGLGGLLGGGMGGGAIGGGLGGLLGGLLGGGMSRGGMGGGLGGLLGGGGNLKTMALMALVAYMMRGRGGAQGFSSLTDNLRGAGLGNYVDSWVGHGQNQDIPPQELARAIPPEALDEVSQQTGLGRDELLSELSRGLPGMVDKLTPHGRMPADDRDLPDLHEDDVLGHFGGTRRT